MAEFSAAVDFVLSNEGGFVDSPSDAGGATNFGISLRFLRDIPGGRLRKYGIFYDDMNIDIVKNLTVDQAKLIYQGEFWDTEPFGSISKQSVVNYVFDCCVLHGTYQGIMILQHALWATYQRKDQIKADGKLGNETLVYEGRADEKTLISSLMACRDGFIRICASHRIENMEFFDGWLNRCYKI